MIGFFADQRSQMRENYQAGCIHSSEGIVAQALRAANGATRPEDEGWRSPFWYPTLSMIIGIKKLLPEEGTEWLFWRARAKEIKDGEDGCTSRCDGCEPRAGGPRQSCLSCHGYGTSTTERQRKASQQDMN